MLVQGADPNVEVNGINALQAAKALKREDIAQLLIKYGDKQ